MNSRTKSIGDSKTLADSRLLADDSSSAAFGSDYETESLAGYPKHENWWYRRNCCCSGVTNRTFVLRVLFFWLFGSIALGFPLLVYVIIPWGIRHSIELSPPIEIKTIDIQKVYATNESMGIWFNAKVPMKGRLSSEFSAAKYSVSILRPGERNSDIGMQLGYFDMQSFIQDKDLGVILNFFTLYSQPNYDNLRKGIKMAMKYIESLLKDEDDIGISRAKESEWRIHLDGSPDVYMLNWHFRKVRVFYNIMMNFDSKKIAGRLTPKLEKCMIGNEEDNMIECSEFGIPIGSKLSQYTPKFMLNQSSSILGGESLKIMDNDDPADNPDSLKIVLTASFVNPTPFAVNFGSMNTTVYYELEDGKYQDIAKVVIPQLSFKMGSSRQNLSVTVIIYDISAAGTFIDTWKSSQVPPELIMPGKALTIGNDHHHVNSRDDPQEGSHTRVKWLEQVFSEFDLRVKLPKFPQDIPILL